MHESIHHNGCPAASDSSWSRDRRSVCACLQARIPPGARAQLVARDAEALAPATLVRAADVAGRPSLREAFAPGIAGLLLVLALLLAPVALFVFRGPLSAGRHALNSLLRALCAAPNHRIHGAPDEVVQESSTTAGI